MDNSTPRSDSAMDLVAGYGAYMDDALELDVSAATDAPATTWYCVAAGVSVVAGATYEATC